MVNILILHYKEPKWMLERLLDSIGTQRNVDFSKIKVRIANDGNKCVIDNFKDYKFDIRYTVEDRQGTSKLRNLLMQEVPEDELLWFLDSDDYLLPDTLAIIQYLTKLKFDCISMAVEREAEDGTVYKCFPGKTAYSMVCAMIYKKSFITRANLYCAEQFFLAGDLVLEQCTKYYSNRTMNIDLPVIHYSYNSDSVVRQQNDNGWKNDRPEVINYCIQKLIDDGKYKAAYCEYMAAISKFCWKSTRERFRNFFNGIDFTKMSL